MSLTFSYETDPSLVDTPGVAMSLTLGSDGYDLSSGRWTVAPDGGAVGAVVSVVKTTPTGGSFDYVCELHPAPSPGVSYRVTLVDQDGAELFSGTETPSPSLIDVLPDPPEYTNFTGYNDAIGQALSSLSGRVATSVYRTMDATSSVLFLRSTYGFPPDGGEIWVSGRRGSYASKTDGGLYGVVFDPPLGESIVEGGEVLRYDPSTRPDAELGPHPEDVGLLWNRLNQTLVDRASGDDLDALSVLYGMTRPSIVPRACWREAMASVAIGPRGLPGGTFSFIREALRYLDTEVEVTFDASDLAGATLPDADGSASWSRRIIDTPYGVLRIVGANSGALSFCPVAAGGASGWEAPGGWDGVASAQTVSCRILPFYLRERVPGRAGDTRSAHDAAWLPAISPVFDHEVAEFIDAYHQPGRDRTVEVMIWSDAIAGVPPTYLQHSDLAIFQGLDGGSTGIWPAAPVGGEVIFFGGGDPFAGVDVVISDASWVEGTLSWKYWDGASWSALSGVSDGTSGFSSDGEISWDIPADWAASYLTGVRSYLVKVTLETYVSGGGGEVDTVVPIRIPGEPIGGVLLSSPDEAGNQEDGPMPVYLSGGQVLYGMGRELQLLLAAQCFCEFLLEDPPSQ